MSPNAQRTNAACNAAGANQTTTGEITDARGAQSTHTNVAHLREGRLTIVPVHDLSSGARRLSRNDKDNFRARHGYIKPEGFT